MPDEGAQWAEHVRGGVLKKEGLQEYGACRIKYLQLGEKAREKEQLSLGEGGVTDNECQGCGERTS